MLTLALPVLAEPGRWHDGGGPGWWLIFPITFGLLWIALGVGAVMLLRRRTAAAQEAARAAADPRTKAESLLAERFARGDIDEDEFYTRLAVLHQSR